MPCSRTQHGLTRVGLEPPTSGSGVRGINHQATVLPMSDQVENPEDKFSHDAASSYCSMTVLDSSNCSIASQFDSIVKKYKQTCIF